MARLRLRYFLPVRTGIMNRLITLLLLIFFSTTLLAGCNTFRGMGQDVQSLGHAISHAAS